MASAVHVEQRPPAAFAVVLSLADPVGLGQKHGMGHRQLRNSDRQSCARV
jgi:hypothetical protein